MRVERYTSFAGEAAHPYSSWPVRLADEARGLLFKIAHSLRRRTRTYLSQSTKRPTGVTARSGGHPYGLPLSPVPHFGIQEVRRRLSAGALDRQRHPCGGRPRTEETRRSSPPRNDLYRGDGTALQAGEHIGNLRGRLGAHENVETQRRGRTRFSRVCPTANRAQPGTVGMCPELCPTRIRGHPILPTGNQMQPVG